MFLLYISLFLFTGYILLMIYYWLSWKAIPEYRSHDKKPQTKFSIIIPARNEEENVLSCLKSVCDQDYPPELFQILIIDDCSTDNTWHLLQNFHRAGIEIHCIRLTEQAGNFAHKKRAIQTGITLSGNEVIITTDADCQPSPGWLRTMASFYEEKKSAFIAAPVVFQNNSSIIEIFQSLDFLVLQGITGASVYKKIHAMCNGANLAYEKSAFEKVNGFEGVDNIASGDDMLLMSKIWKKFPGKAHYLKSKQAIVSTLPAKTWKEFFNQRIRWASKARFYNDKKVFFVLLLVYLFNLSFLALLVAGFWLPVLWIFVIALWVAKTIIELPFVYSVATYFNKQSLLKYFFFFQPLHIAYTVIAGWMGQFGKYEWKGRRVK